MKVIKLKTPITFEDKEYTELNFDIEALTGRDLVKAEQEAAAISPQGLMPELSKSYNAVVAGKACKVPVDLIMALSVKDFTFLTVSVQNFLML